MRKFRIMIIDGNRENVASFKTVIEKALPESEVFSAADSVSGIALIKKTAPDVILIDSEQTSESTLMISQIMKEDRDLQAIPVLLITDLEADRQLRIKAIDSGVESFLFKPLDETILITQLKTMRKVRERNLLIIKNKAELEDLVKFRTQELRQEISERVKGEERLEESETKFRVYIEKAPIGVFITDCKGRMIEVNEKASQLSGYTREELLGLSLADYLFREDPVRSQKDFEEIVKSGILEAEYHARKKFGVWNWIKLIGTKINEDRIIFFCSDITISKEREQEIEYLSYHDVLCKVYNRTFFEAELIRQNRSQVLPFSLILCDFNGLKLVNDALGHSAGDKMLIETASILKTFARIGDTVSRVGGDEFAILLPETTNKESGAISKKILEAFREHKAMVFGHELALSVSLGYATKTKKNETFSYIIKLAEDNMYRHKLLERSSYHSSFLESLKTSLFERSHETVEHAKRLVMLSQKISRLMDLGIEQSEKLELLATLHDIGKISIDNSILIKTGALSEEEWLEMKKHPSIGYRIAMASSGLKSIAEEILCHHERWDGTGYPQGIGGDEIPLLSRILSIIDAYDAMTNDRPYRKALSHEFALSEIERNSGTQFDPDVVNIFLNTMVSTN